MHWSATLMTRMLPKPICRNNWSTMGSFARLSLKLRSNTKRLLLRKQRPKRAFFNKHCPEEPEQVYPSAKKREGRGSKESPPGSRGGPTSPDATEKRPSRIAIVLTVFF